LCSLIVAGLLVAGFLYFSDFQSELGLETDADAIPRELETVKVQLKWLHQSQFAGFYAAEQLGYYEKQGIDIELLPGGPTISPERSLAEGKADFAVVGGFDLLKAYANGQDIKAIAAIYQITPTIFMTLSSRNFDDIDDFENKRIGIQQSEQQMLYKAMMKNHDLDPTTMTEVAASYDLKQMLDNSLDIMPGYVINERLMAMEQNVPVSVFYPADYGVRVLGDVIAAPEITLDNNPALVRRFLAATAQGWEYVISHPEEAPEFVIQYNPGADKDHELRMMQQSLPLVKPYGTQFGYMHDEIWADMSALLEENNMIDVPIKPKNIYDMQFLQKR